MLDDQNLSEDDESSSYTESYESSTESDLDSDRLLDTDTDCQDSDSISKCTSTNLIQLLHQSRQNGRDHHTFDSLISCLSQYREYQFHENRFNSQITSLCWHPDRHQQLITGTASGFISLFHVPFSSDGSHSGQSNNFIGIRRSKARACKPSSHDPLPVHEQCLKEWPGHGRGSRICSIVFDRNDSNRFYVTGDEGRLVHYQMESSCPLALRVIITEDPNEWNPRLITLRHHQEKNVLLTGDNKGQVHLIPANSIGQNNSITTKKLHQAHVTEIELLPSLPELFLTCSWDGRLCLWDIRNLETSVAERKFKNPLNSISLSSDNRLLCNDTNHHLYVLDSLELNHNRTWRHPHIQQQRAALLRSRLHPNSSRMAIVARHEGSSASSSSTKNQTKTVIDLVDLNCGQSRHQFQLQTSQFCSINEFNSGISQILASTAHNRLSVWMSAREQE